MIKLWIMDKSIGMTQKSRNIVYVSSNVIIVVNQALYTNTYGEGIIS